MTKTTRYLMIVSIGCLTAGMAFVTGVIDVRSAVALYVALPAGTIIFGLFMIFRMLEKESALYDEEQRAHRAVRLPARKMEEGCGRNCEACEAGATLR